MSDEHWLDSETGAWLLAAVVDRIVKDYRIDRTEAASLVKEVWAGRTKLQLLVTQGKPPAEILRTREFESAATSARKAVYYGLRRYRQTHPDRGARLLNELKALEPAGPALKRDELAAQLAGLHVSMAERTAGLSLFYDQLFSLIGQPRTVLDVGCGVHPLVFPFDGQGGAVESYLAGDKDAQAIAAVEAYAAVRSDGRLQGLIWDLAQGWAAINQANSSQWFDVVFMFKLIPHLARQQPHLLPVAAQAPGRLLVITASRQSLTKKQSIERRERAVLHRFVTLTGRRVIGEFSVDEEFGLVLE
ncbi:MAG: hypothetical protein HQK59_18235 [Deltaproteobacteria bacterium]|nr:hypothetical protein [Deltaproteobacteria bacterium]